jgi:uncharacterized membrane protein
MVEGSYSPPPVPGSVPPPPPSGGTVSPNRSVMIVLSYLGVLALVPLLTEKDDREVQWHAKNGLVLAVAEIVLWIGLHFVLRIVAHLTLGFGGCLLLLVYPVLGLGILALHVMCIMKGVNGQRLVIPVLSDFANKL